jgi:hypothetical protein
VILTSFYRSTNPPTLTDCVLPNLETNQCSGPLKTGMVKTKKKPGTALRRTGRMVKPKINQSIGWRGGFD